MSSTPHASGRFPFWTIGAVLFLSYSAWFFGWLPVELEQTDPSKYLSQRNQTGEDASFPASSELSRGEVPSPFFQSPDETSVGEQTVAEKQAFPRAATEPLPNYSEIWSRFDQQTATHEDVSTQPMRDAAGSSSNSMSAATNSQEEFGLMPQNSPVARDARALRQVLGTPANSQAPQELSFGGTPPTPVEVSQYETEQQEARQTNHGADAENVNETEYAEVTIQTENLTNGQLREVPTDPGPPMRQALYQTENSEDDSVRNLAFNPQRDEVNVKQLPYRTGESSIRLTSATSSQVDPASGANTASNTSPVPTTTQSRPAVDQPIAGSSENVTPRERVLKHRELSTRYWSHPEERAELLPKLQRNAKEIYFDQATHYLPAYTVQPGDQLGVIARKYNVPWEYLARLNRIAPEKIRPGQELKVMKGPFSAVVDLSDMEITIHSQGYYMCSFPVGIGKENSTPTGKFTVLNKEPNPKYWGSDGVVIERDDHANPLGERWIDLGNSYGIHGTIDPSSIGQADSRGCVRMHNSHVAIVYDLLSIGSEVVIRP